MIPLSLTGRDMRTAKPYRESLDRMASHTGLTLPCQIRTIDLFEQPCEACTKQESYLQTH